MGPRIVSWFQQGNSMRSRLNCWPKVGHWLHNAVCLSSHTHTHTVLNHDCAPRHASTHDVNAREREHTLKKQANDDEQIDFTDRASALACTYVNGNAPSHAPATVSVASTTCACATATTGALIAQSAYARTGMPS